MTGAITDTGCKGVGAFRNQLFPISWKCICQLNLGGGALYRRQYTKFISGTISWEVLAKSHMCTYAPLFPYACCCVISFGLCWFDCRGASHHRDYCGAMDAPIVKPDARDPLPIKEKFIQAKVCPSMSFICLFTGHLCFGVGHVKWGRYRGQHIHLKQLEVEWAQNVWSRLRYL